MFTLSMEEGFGNFLLQVLSDLDLAIKSIQREGEIYVYLSDHPTGIKCLAIGDLFVDP